MIKILFLMTLCSLALAADNQTESMPTVPRFVMGVFLPGVNDEVNLSDIRVAMDFWMQEISHEMNVLDGHTVFFTDMKEMAQSFQNKQIDMIVAPPLSIVKHFNLTDLEDGYAGVRANGQLNSLILLVKNDPSIDTLADLRGKRLLIPENDELSEVFIDTEVMKINKQNYQNFFGSVSHQKKNARLVLDLFFGKSDAAIVYLGTYDVMTELNPQVKANTKILLSYPLRSKNFSFFHKDYAPRRIILEHIDSFVKNPRGHQILEIFKTEELTTASTEELRPIKALYEEYRRLKSAKAK